MSQIDLKQLAYEKFKKSMGSSWPTRENDFMGLNVEAILKRLFHEGYEAAESVFLTTATERTIKK